MYTSTMSSKWIVMKRVAHVVNACVLRRRTYAPNTSIWRTTLSTSASDRKQSDTFETGLQHIDEHFEAIPPKQRNKTTFNTAIELFRQKKSATRGHVEFINSALKYLEEYGLHKDLDTYKALLNVFPKGAMIPRNAFQKIFLHYPMQQNCCVKVLDQMEWFGVQPDKEVHDIVANAFGEWNFATRKIKRMLYWMPKLKHSNKYLDRRCLEGRQVGPVELAFIALKMMARDPGTAFSLVKIKDLKLAESKRWLVSAQSVLQQRMLEAIKAKSTLYVDGPNRVYVMDRKVNYVWLTSDPDPEGYFDNFRPDSEDDNDFENWRSRWQRGGTVRRERNIHEQRDETILGLAVLAETNDQTAAAWINHLTEANPSMKELRVLFRIKHANTDLAVSESQDSCSAQTASESRA
ncbi:Evolutionarily conserved signaling intermediate in Toll pathway, mitochondrial [Toxocara canis]|uniref:Evolutionarily conserved signaling intermediate in Toll pathway, mitochondrial n=1 Tax=Toxocara canis TaxID=6265 RepID=A0A0B2VLD0_TOXCA|nr:Evolutionarily conserved signaling intermediate in Toll pathway, mitochondrial [Toxocara canis]